jgi:hypothetical protein
MRSRAPLLIALACASTARADRDEPAPPRRDAAASASTGDFLPFTEAARIGDRRVMAVALGGWDGTSGSGGRGAVLSATVEGAIANRIALRAGADYTAANTSAFAGVRVSLLRQETHGLDLALSATYRSVGFTEGSGDLEMGVLVSRRWGRLLLVGNAIYAQGFLAQTRHGEVRAAALLAATERLQIGLDSRCRFDLGSVVAQGSAVGAEVDLDLLAGPTASLALGPVALIAQAGVHVLALENGPTRAGPVAIAGLGASF